MTALADAAGSSKSRWTIQHVRNGEVLDEQTADNLITNSGRDFLHAQGYSTGALPNGLNWIGLSDDVLNEDQNSVDLSNEIIDFGLIRTQGSVGHGPGDNITKISASFIATDKVACQKAALFSDKTGGTMNHVVAFSERSLLAGDTLQVTIAITLG